MPRVPILHEDAHLLVVDKPAHVLVVPAPGRRGPTVLDLLGRQLGTRLEAVHRLDEDTTGVLVLARSHEAKEKLEEIFRRHEAERVYLALLSHAPSPAAGRIDSRMREVRPGIMGSVTSGPGETAVTHYRTLLRGARGYLVECRPQTGRRNQIRVHMAEIGCPVVGDRKYGFRGRRRDRVLLHAFQISLSHPFSHEELRVQAWPKEQELCPPGPEPEDGASGAVTR